MDPSKQDQGMLLIISGPSGVGKTTIAHGVEKALDGLFSVSVTTRPKTVKDREGVDYDFVGLARFEHLRDTGQLLEWAKVFDHYYGTPREPVERALKAGRLMILEIDVQGAIQVKRELPGVFAVFVLPPASSELLARLRARKRESEAKIQERFAQANEEVRLAKSNQVYDVFVINDNLDAAITEAVAAVRREMGKRGAKSRVGGRVAD
jgi:guanylate kinase